MRQRRGGVDDSNLGNRNEVVVAIGDPLGHGFGFAIGEIARKGDDERRGVDDLCAAGAFEGPDRLTRQLDGRRPPTVLPPRRHPRGARRRARTARMFVDQSDQRGAIGATDRRVEDDIPRLRDGIGGQADDQERQPGAHILTASRPARSAQAKPVGYTRSARASGISSAGRSSARARDAQTESGAARRARSK